MDPCLASFACLGRVALFQSSFLAGLLMFRFSSFELLCAFSGGFGGSSPVNLGEVRESFLSGISIESCLWNFEYKRGDGDLVELPTDMWSSKPPFPVSVPSFALLEGTSKDGDFESVLREGDRLSSPQGVWMQAFSEDPELFRLTEEGSRDSGHKKGVRVGAGDLSLCLSLGTGDLVLSLGDFSLGDLSPGLGEGSFPSH